jgi:hypothetical protein
VVILRAREGVAFDRGLLLLHLLLLFPLLLLPGEMKKGRKGRGERREKKEESQKGGKGEKCSRGSRFVAVRSDDRRGAPSPSSPRGGGAGGRRRGERRGSAEGCRGARVEDDDEGRGGERREGRVEEVEL